jgi:hypothetical protein
VTRSYRKTPIFGYTTCHSEKHDKFIWHKKWCLRERINLATVIKGDLENHCSVHQRQVSNVWLMGKDGKHYFSHQEQKDHAELISSIRSKNPQEKSSLKKRIIYQWIGK